MRVHIKIMHVIVFLSLLNIGFNSYAACVDNGDGTSTCDGTTDIVDTNISNRILLDNTLSPVTFSFSTLDIENFGQASITQSAPDVAEYSIISALGNQGITINNTGGVIFMLNDVARDFSGGLSNDANGLLLSGGNPVGMAAAIRAGSNVSSLTINNNSIADGKFYANTGTVGLSGNIVNFGQFTASVFTNTPVLTINTKGSLGDVLSYGAGVSNINAEGADFFILGGYGNVFVVDRNPLLTQAQALDPSLVLAYGPDDVGPRDSVINLKPGGSIFNLVLGSGTHIVNVENFDNQYSISNIMVDQRDAEVVSVVGGVATTVSSVHGGRSFTLNSNHHAGLGNIVLNDVVGAVNTLNIGGITDGQVFGSILANGLGNNTLNINCVGPNNSSGNEVNPNSPCDFAFTTVSGMTNINFTGSTSILGLNWSATDNINIIDTKLILNENSTITANNVVVGSGASLFAIGERFRNSNNKIGIISANLINNGEVYVGDTTLNVNGNATMNDGAKLTVGVGSSRAGLLNATATTFTPNSAVQVEVKSSILVREGDTHLVANNVTSKPQTTLQLEEGLPINAEQASGFLQWSSQLVGSDLFITANTGVSEVLRNKVTPAAANAADAFFAYRGSDRLPVELLTELQTFTGLNAQRVAERLRPEIHDGAIRMVLGNTDKFFNILDTRLLSSYLPIESVVGEDGEVVRSGNGLWVQGFGNRASQEGMQGADGYGMSSVGMAAGIDKSIGGDGNMRAGLAFGYARGNVVNDGNTVNNRLDTSSYMLAIYASSVFDDYFINGMFGIGRHVYETERNLLRYTASGAHDGRQFAAHVGTGMPLLLSDAFTFTPLLSIDYSRVKENGYSENSKESIVKLDSLGGPVYENGLQQFQDVPTPLNLNIASRSVNSIRGGIGARAIYKLEEPTWSAELELHGMLRREFGNIAQDTKASFVMGTESFKSNGIDPARNDFTVGGSIQVTGDDEDDQLTFLTSYDANFREKYFGQNISLNLRYDFDQAPRYLKQASNQRVLQATRSPEQAVHATDKDVNEISSAMKAKSADTLSLSAEQQAVRNTLNNWLTAQGNKSPEMYLNSYASDFTPSEGGTRQQWERKRRFEISNASNVAVTISYLKITPIGNQAIAIFNESIQDNDNVTIVRKIMDFENRNGRWLIVREDSVAIPQSVAVSN